MRCDDPFSVDFRRPLSALEGCEFVGRLVRCRSRLDSRCAGCASVAKGDWSRIIRDGLDQPGAVFFLTLTAPGFGVSPIYRSQFRKEWAATRSWDERSYDYKQHIDWQWDFPQRWKNTHRRISRSASSLGVPTPAWIRVSEPHVARGLSHHHVLVRADSKDAGARMLEHDWRELGWGEQYDLKFVGDGDFDSWYLTKYLTKSVTDIPSMTNVAEEQLRQHHELLYRYAREHVRWSDEIPTTRGKRLYGDKLGERHRVVSKSKSWSELTMKALDDERRSWLLASGIDPKLGECVDD